MEVSELYEGLCCCVVVLTHNFIHRTKGDAWWGSYNKEVYGGARKDGWGKWLYR